MTNLTLRTEFSTRFAAGKIADVLDCQEDDSPAGICDKDGTWGHVQWQKACKKRNIRATFGVELSVVGDMELREKQPVSRLKLIAKDHSGLKELYDAMSLATEKFYFHPRIDYGYLGELLKVKGLYCLVSNFDPEKLGSIITKRHKPLMELNQSTTMWHMAAASKLSLPVVATQDNYFPRADSRKTYQLIMGSKNVESRPSPMHILTRGEWWAQTLRHGLARQSGALKMADEIGNECAMWLPTGHIVLPEKPDTLEGLCRGAAKRRGIDLSDPVYEERLKYELGLIESKNFEDYFYVVSDMVKYAKTVMLVGPARGSSCGSLVCYLLDITDIDPIPFGLMFERFIDVNREDYPDIDIDFAEDRRTMVFDYMGKKYGYENVARLGTVSQFKPKSAITDAARELEIPVWEVKDLKESIIERSGGDARAALCILDTFAESEVGRKVLEKFPELAACAEMEGHARHTGVHAAGIVLTDKPMTNYCTIDARNGAAQLDKYDSEALSLLKIDALGLRTLTVLQDCLDQVGHSREWLVSYPLDDQAAFAILNDTRFSGIFQFEGASLKILVSHMRIMDIEDVIAATALARPGPLASGGTNEYCRRKSGHTKVEKIHPILDAITEPTFGIVIYQEQVMKVARELGELSWADVSDLRRAMSKSLGKEFFDKFYEKFLIGSRKHGLTDEVSKQIWDTINTMGSWAFNRSHAVAYGLVSYWCCVMKAHHPLEFALACLRSAKDDEQSVYILRDLVKEGFEYKNFDKDKSEVNWTAQDGILVGGLSGIKGIGEKLAQDIVNKRKGINKNPLTKRQKELLETGVTPWDDVFACAGQWGHLKSHGPQYGITSAITDINTINEDQDGVYVVIGKIKQKKTRDANEAILVEKRGGKKVAGQSIFMNLVIEDDTGEILAGVSRQEYLTWGVPLVEDSKLGDWYLWKGKVQKGFRRINVTRWKRLTGNPIYTPIDSDSEPEELPA